MFIEQAWSSAGDKFSHGRAQPRDIVSEGQMLKIWYLRSKTNDYPKTQFKKKDKLEMSENWKKYYLNVKWHFSFINSEVDAKY